MLTKIGVFVLMALGLLAGQLNAQECYAQNVVNLTLEASHNLSWEIRPDELCQIEEYLVYIFHPNQPADYAFSVTEKYVDVSFLEVCEEWTFVVVPVSGHTMGAQRRIVEKLPLPLDASLAVDHLNVLYNLATGRADLSWELVDKRLGDCSLRYRVSVEEAGSPIIEDFYVDRNSIHLPFVSSCTAYQFGVRAINIAQPTIEGPLRSVIHTLPGKRQHPPVLNDIQVGTTSVNVSFRLESEVRNPCPVRELYITDHENIYVTIKLNDDEPRFPVNATIPNLEPDTTYAAWAYVYNSIGWSTSTDVNFKTLDLDLHEEQWDAIEERD